MALDLGNIPVYETPSEAEQAQIREAIGINDNIGTSTADALARKAAKGGVVSSRTGTTTWTIDDAPMAAFGTNDFSIVWDGATVDTTAATKTFINAANGSVPFGIQLDRDTGTAYDAGSLRFFINANTYLIDYGSDIFEDDAIWKLSLDRSADATLYRNGELVGSVDISADVATIIDTTLYDIGIRQNTGWLLRDLVYFNTALTAQQAAAIYTYGIDEFLARNKELKWGGVEGGVYTSDFSAGVDGWADLSATVTGNVDAIGGLDDNLSIQPDATTAAHRSDQVLLITGKAQKITCDVYIPSANVLVDTFFIREAVSGLISNSVTATDTWTAVELSLDSVVNSTIQLFPSDGGSTTYLSNGTDLVYVRNIKITDLGALSHLPLNDDCRQLRDVSTNRFDAIASATGVEHILPKDTHVFRDDNADGTGGSYLVAAADILTASETITGVTVEGRFYAASGAQTLSYRRIRLLTSGSDILVQRSNGTTHETIATVTPVSVTDFAISVSTQRV